MGKDLNLIYHEIIQPIETRTMPKFPEKCPVCGRPIVVNKPEGYRVGPLVCLRWTIHNETSNTKSHR